MKKILALIIFIFLPFVFAEGSGTLLDPYKITNCVDLQNINGAPGSYYVLSNDIDCSDTVNWNNGSGFRPIGNLTSKFSGFLNGAGFMISNIYINRPDQNYIGLFGYSIHTVTIHNLSIINANISGHDFVGGLFGLRQDSDDDGSWKTEINNLKVSGSIKGNDYVGGLFGQFISTEYRKFGTIDIIKNASANIIIIGNNYVGGFAGFLSDGGSSNGRNFFIDNTRSIGLVTGNNYVGGHVGYLQGYYDGQMLVRKSYSEADVIGKLYVGGFIGYQDGSGPNCIPGLASVENSYARGNVNGVSFVGGFVGFSKGICGQSYILNSYSSGNVVGFNNVGGFLGDSNGSVIVSNSFWDVNASNQWISNKGIGYTTKDMKNPSTFKNYDWDIWSIYENNYPHLRWEENFSIDFNTKPLLPVLDRPLDNTQRIPSSVYLRVIPYDSDQDSMTIDFYDAYNNSLLGTVKVQNKVLGKLLWGGLKTNKTYEWYVIITDKDGSVQSPKWKFNTLDFFEGRGMDLDPYNISTCEDLQEIKDFYNPDNITFYYILTNDIDCAKTINWSAGKGFQPIGNSTNKFSGFFDGNGFKILDLYINRSNEDYVGLFSYSFHDVTVKNLSLIHADISGHNYVGVLFGIRNNINNDGSWKTQILNTRISGKITGNDYVGTVAGQISSNQYYGYPTIDIIQNVSINADVAGNNYVGGFAGRLEDSWSSNGQNFYVDNTYFKGNVNGNFYVGGYVGYQQAGSSGAMYIRKSYSNANITGNQYVAGFVGFQETTGAACPTSVSAIENSYAEGNVIGNSFIGGLVGYSKGFCGQTSIFNSYTSQKVVGFNNVSGLLGAKEGNVLITNSFWDIQSSRLNFSSGGQGKTTAEMMNKSTFVGWDFVNIWNISEGVDYPRLIWERSSCSSNLEKCNNVDDNCNNQIDEGFNVRVNCTSLPNQCGDANYGSFVCFLDNQSTFCNVTVPLERVQWNQTCLSVPNLCGQINSGVTDCDGTCTALPPLNPDIDLDGVPDCVDNCVNVSNHLQSDIDYDVLGDACDSCPNDASNSCNPVQSGSSIIGIDGGNMSSADGDFMMQFPPGAVDGNSSFSVTGISPINANFRIGSTQGVGVTLASYDVEPTGTYFQIPVTIILKVNVTGYNAQQKNSLAVYVHNVITNNWEKLSSICIISSDIATCSAQTIHLTTFGVVTFLDSDNDGIQDDFEGIKDNCNQIYNPDQFDLDFDRIGNVCDACLNDKNNDEDKDGVCGDVDKCSGTSKDILSESLKPNRYADIDGDGIFETIKSNQVVKSSLNLTGAYGCNCKQILSCKGGNNLGELMWGCTGGNDPLNEATLGIWVHKNSWAKACSIY